MANEKVVDMKERGPFQMERLYENRHLFSPIDRGDSLYSFESFYCKRRRI